MALGTSYIFIDLHLIISSCNTTHITLLKTGFLFCAQQQVVAVFGSMHMGASRIMNLQRHRIAQCRSIVIRVLGNEGVPVQVDGEAWLHPPGIIRIVHKNRVQLVCRDKVNILLLAVIPVIHNETAQQLCM